MVSQLRSAECLPTHLEITIGDSCIPYPNCTQKLHRPSFALCRPCSIHHVLSQCSRSPIPS
ncbi:unnamed protein product, partial [Nesidiocoris tenuis]